MDIRLLQQSECCLWDDYVTKHPDASVYHLTYFRSVVETTYKHKSYYLVASKNSEIQGVLPLFYVKSFLFGNALVSLPFCDYGGILANDPETGEMLFKKALELSTEFKCPGMELRQTKELTYLGTSHQGSHFKSNSVLTSKVRMKLKLTDTTDSLFSSFPAKLRSQIRKPQKEGCSAKCGGLELLDDFYEVFVHNMRDLGSPVHTKKVMARMLQNYPDKTRLFVVYHKGEPVACSLVSGFNDVLVNPWASFKRNSQKIAPNMLLYWEMLCFAVQNGYRYFDFGRSTPDEGTYKFKEQWGAIPELLFWYSYSTNESSSGDESKKKEAFIKLWRKIPLPVTRLIGPMLRRHIHL